MISDFIQYIGEKRIKRTYAVDLIHNKIKASIQKGEPLAKEFSYSELTDFNEVCKGTWNLLKEYTSDLLKEVQNTEKIDFSLQNLAWFDWLKTSLPKGKGKQEEIIKNLSDANKELHGAPDWKLLSNTVLQLQTSKDTQSIKFQNALFQSFFITNKLSREGMVSLKEAQIPLQTDVLAFLNAAGTIKKQNIDLISKNVFLNKNYQDRFHALLSLVGEKEALLSNIFLDRLEKDRSMNIRELIIEIYESEKTPELEQRVKNIFEKDPSNKLRFKAFQTLILNIIDEEELQMLVSKGMNDDDYTLCEEAFKIASELKLEVKKEQQLPISPESAVIKKEVNTLIKKIKRGPAIDRDKAIEKIAKISHPNIRDFLIEIWQKGTPFSEYTEWNLKQILVNYAEDTPAIEVIVNQSIKSAYQFVDKWYNVRRYSIREFLPLFLKRMPLEKFRFIIQLFKKKVAEESDQKRKSQLLDDIAKIPLGTLLKERPDRKQAIELIKEMDAAETDENFRKIFQGYKYHLGILDDTLFLEKIQVLKSLKAISKPRSEVQGTAYTERNMSILGNSGLYHYNPREDWDYLKKIGPIIDYIVPLTIEYQHHDIIPLLKEHLGYFQRFSTRAKILSVLFALDPNEKEYLVKQIFKESYLELREKEDIELWFKTAKKGLDLEVYSEEKFRENALDFFSRIDFQPPIILRLIELFKETFSSPYEDLENAFLNFEAELFGLCLIFRWPLHPCNGNLIENFLYTINVRAGKFNDDISHLRDFIEEIVKNPMNFDLLMLNLMYARPYWDWYSDYIKINTYSVQQVPDYPINPSMSAFYASHLCQLARENKITEEQKRILRESISVLLTDDLDLLNQKILRLRNKSYLQSKYFRKTVVEHPRALYPHGKVELIKLAWEIDPDIVKTHLEPFLTNDSEPLRNFVRDFAQEHKISLGKPVTQLKAILTNALQVETKWGEEFTNWLMAGKNLVDSHQLNLIEQIYFELPIELKHITLKLISFGNFERYFDFAKKELQNGSTVIREAAFDALLSLKDETAEKDVYPIFFELKIELKEKVALIENILKNHQVHGEKLIYEFYLKESRVSEVPNIIRESLLQIFSNKNCMTKLSIEFLQNFLPPSNDVEIQFLKIQTTKLRKASLKSLEERALYWKLLNAGKNNTKLLREFGYLKDATSLQHFLSVVTLTPELLEKILISIAKKPNAKKMAVLLEIFLQNEGYILFAEENQSSRIFHCFDSFFQKLPSDKVIHTQLEVLMSLILKKVKHWEDVCSNSNDEIVKKALNEADRLIHYAIQISDPPKVIIKKIGQEWMLGGKITWFGSARFLPHGTNFRVSLHAWDVEQNFKSLANWGFAKEIKNNVIEYYKSEFELCGQETTYISEFLEFIEWLGEYCQMIPNSNQEITDLLVMTSQKGSKQVRSAATISLQKMQYF